MRIDPPYGQVLRLPQRKLRPPVPQGASVLQDVQAAQMGDLSATALVLATLPATGKTVLWVQDRASQREEGRLYLPGSCKPALRGPLIRVEVGHARDALWAMEEGAACAGLGAVVGEIHGNPKALDFTATKRLALRAEASGVPVWLIRSHDAQGLSAARERWRVSAALSLRHPHDPGAPGDPRWQVELVRAQGRAPGKWIARYDPEADRFDMVSPSGDGAVAGGDAK
ncbi:MAG: ImuA family protein [Roseovarius sp.]